MDPIIFTVVEEEDGWFVDGPHRIGPLPTRAAVVELAEELATWLRANGEDAHVVYARRLH